MATVKKVPLSQRTLLATAVRESGRGTSVQLPGAFAFDDDGEDPLLAKLWKLGEPAFKVYLTLVLGTRKPPHELYRGTSAARYARMLGYDPADIDTAASVGTRRVQRALASLHEHGFIVRTRRAGRVDLIRVNHHATKLRPPYVTIPLDLWRNGWINVLPGPALFAYLVLRHACAGDETRTVHIPPYLRPGYGLSDETWAKGTRQLASFGLLTVSEGSPYDRDVPHRRRKLYRLRSSKMERVATKKE